MPWVTDKAFRSDRQGPGTNDKPFTFTYWAPGPELPEREMPAPAPGIHCMVKDNSSWGTILRIKDDKALVGWWTADQRGWKKTDSWSVRVECGVDEEWVALEDIADTDQY